MTSPHIPSTTAPARNRYIVHSNHAESLADFILMASRDPGIVLEDLIGPTDQPHTAIVIMSAGAAEACKRTFCDTKKLTIEPDRPLWP